MRPGRGGQPGHFPTHDEAVTEANVRQLIQKGGKLLVDAAEKLGPRLNRGRLTTSQIRNIYGAVKQMEMAASTPTSSYSLSPSWPMRQPERTVMEPAS